MMRQQNSLQTIEQLWERAVEQAGSAQARKPELGVKALNSAAGLQVRSGVTAGGWGASSNNCSAQLSCDNC